MINASRDTRQADLWAQPNVYLQQAILDPWSFDTALREEQHLSMQNLQSFGRRALCPCFKIHTVLKKVHTHAT